MSAASSATGMSEVPAATTNTRPAPGRSTGLTTASEAVLSIRTGTAFSSASSVSPRALVARMFWCPNATMRSAMATTCSVCLPAQKMVSQWPRRSVRWWSMEAKPRSS